jgi:PAS domain S-box-containing protein
MTKTDKGAIISAAGGAALAALILYSGYLLYGNITEWRLTDDNIRHAQASIRSAEKVYFQNVAAESALRRYIITGDRDALAPFNKAVTEMDTELASLMRLEREHPDHQHAKDKLAAAVARRKTRFQETILLRREKGFMEARLRVLTGEGTRLSEEIRAASAEFADMERSHLRNWQLESQAASAQRGRLLTAVFLAAFLGLAGLLALALRNARRSNRAEAALAATNLHLKGVLNAATQISIISTDTSGVITVFSAGAEKMLGYGAAEMIGRTPAAFHLPEEMEARSRELSATLRRPVTGFDVFVEVARTAPYERREWTYVRKDGRRLTVELTVTAVRNASGEITGFLGIASDVTSQRHAQMQMRKLSTAVKASPTSIVITDRNAKIEYANPKFFELTGYTEKEMLGQDPKLLSSGKIPKSTIKELWDTILDGREWHGELLNRKKSGELFWEHASISPVKDPAGNVTHFIAVKVDITDRKLAQRETEKAKDAALELARMKSEFLANMSHEIRTPMNAIIGMAGLLQDTPLTPRQKDYANTITTAGEALLDIINDILDFSKIESGKLVLEKADFDLRETVESTLDLLAPRAQAKGLELASSLAHGVPAAMRGDAGRLRQVLMNLLGNSVKFTERGEILVRVSRADAGPGSAVLRFEVKDTGIGVPPEAQRTLFSAFVQADASTTRKYGGTGLGLSICKRLVEMMGGEIGMESEPGRGSTFWFTIPLEEARSAPPPPDASALAGVRALVVDDNAASREIVSIHLADWKMAAEAAASARAALEALRRAAASGSPFRLVITDMQMPEMDGLMLAAAVKGDPALAGTRVVMMTSLGQDFSRLDREAAGLAACVHKPLRRAALLSALTAALSGRPEKDGEDKGQEEAAAPKRYFRVLVAEDNAVNQKVAVRQLEKLGYECDLAANGIETLEAMKRRHYDLVLMDCNMPEMDGFQATAEIRRMEGDQRHTPVVAMTANALEGDREKCLAAGMDGYIPKPVRLENLAETLKQWDASLDLSTVKGLAELGGAENPDFMKELAGAYLGDLPRRLDAIRAAFKAGDAEALRQAAHALKGSSGNLGAQRMQKICSLLEQAGRSGDMTAAGRLMDALEKEAPSLKAAMEALAAGKPAQ